MCAPPVVFCGCLGKHICVSVEMAGQLGVDVSVGGTYINGVAVSLSDISIVGNNLCTCVVSRVRNAVGFCPWRVALIAGNPLRFGQLMGFPSSSMTPNPFDGRIPRLLSPVLR